MSKLTKNNRYAILWLNYIGLTKEEISQELKLESSQISRVIKNYTNENSKDNNTDQNIDNEQIQTTVRSKTSKDFMITRTSEKQNNTVAIMTKAASEMNDEIKKKNQNIIPTVDRPGIFRPNNG